jgi:hypothetical protein
MRNVRRRPQSTGEKAGCRLHAYEKGRKQISALKKVELVTSTGSNGDEQAVVGPIHNKLSTAEPLKEPMEAPIPEMLLDYTGSNSSSSGDNVTWICVQRQRGEQHDGEARVAEYGGGKAISTQVPPFFSLRCET